MKLNLPSNFTRLLLLTLVSAFVFCGNAFAQNTIRGIVLDNNNQPLPGVTIKVKGTTRATVTGIEGRFTFAAEKGETLVVSIIGFISQEVTVTSETYYSIQMQQESKNLNEVVVTALGVKKEFQRLGYSQSQINGDDLTTARDANPFQSM
ncbi:MAG TPA: carboxypeptidase-like regulatory domain-containing protein, partial [Mucilaginibacter sp.]|nr:carboxypeptidase-like regulatory domain-containing protein [Mucilaginibacter sp.]